MTGPPLEEMLRPSPGADGGGLGRARAGPPPVRPRGGAAASLRPMPAMACACLAGPGDRFGRRDERRVEDRDPLSNDAAGQASNAVPGALRGSVRPSGMRAK